MRAYIILVIVTLASGFGLASGQELPNLLSVPGQGQVGQSAEAAAEVKVGIELVAQYEPVGDGRRMAVAVVLDVHEDWHLYANPKQGEFGIETEIRGEPGPYFRFGKVIYPLGREYFDKELNAGNHIYEGRVVFYVPVEIIGLADAIEFPDSADMKFDITGLLCSAGTCLPWKDSGEVKIRFAADGGKVQSNRAELFDDFDIESVDWGDTDIQAGVDTSASSEMVIAEDNWVKPILLALAAGLIMNLMPCVLPLIPIIVMTLMKQCSSESGEPDRGKSVKVGLIFGAGIIFVFIALAVVMGVFKLLWGQQFQGNVFKFVLLIIVYVLSLSMFGMFEIVLPARISNITVLRKGYLGTFAMGMLVTVLATPCGAPLLTPVLAWSLSKPLPVIISMFLLIGIGMASPYILLTVFPNLIGRVPKGGNWMIRLKQAIGFFMLGFSAYLIILFPAGWHGPLLYFCLILGFGIWLGFSVVNFNTPVKKRYLVRAIVLLLFIVGSVGLVNGLKDQKPARNEGHWYKQLMDYQQEGKTVIVKFTANWCKNCATLDKFIYKRKEFHDKLAETNAEYVIADWSYDDPSIKQMLLELGGAGQSLPFAAVFPRSEPDEPILLRDLYSLEDTLEALERAKKN